MNCPSCAHENRPTAKFCEECAAPLVRVCSRCGAELRPTAKFCDECAAPVAAAAGGRSAAPAPDAIPAGSDAGSRPAGKGAGDGAARRPASETAPDVDGVARASAGPAGARKVVTILFADLVGSTALHERLDPESARRFMESYYAAAREAVEGHGGTVTQLLGDGVKAVFGVPQVAEDDAIRAVRAGVALQESFRELAEGQRAAIGETGLRVAVNTGEVVAQDESEIIGDPVNVAARLQEQGGDGDVVVGQTTERLVASQVTLEPLGSFSLKGRAEAVKAYRVLTLEAPAEATTASFVGRDAELARLTAVFDEAVAKPAAQLTVLVGSPGLGKSRLVGEFARRVAEKATVVSAHCDAAGGATFAPIAEAFRAHFGIEAGASAEASREPIEAALAGDDADRKRIATGVAALVAGSPPPPEETFFVVRRLLGRLAASRPVILVVDDLQWAEPLLLDLVEHLIEWGGGVRLLVLVGARPELRDVRASLVTPGGVVSDVVTLTGLDAGVATKLAANVIGADDLPAAVAARVLAASEGNPLFIGELVRMLVHEGALVREGDRWTTGRALETIEMPPTIHALLAARIERLDADARTVLETASVVGRHFSRSSVAELLPPGFAKLDERLKLLRQSELVERDTGWLLGEPQLRFHHVLIRDAAYGRILKGTRAGLHERFANWAETKTGESPEHDELIGRHLEQAHRLLGELGPIDAAGRTIGERASARLAAAGRRALERDDEPLAAGLLGRAIARLDPDDRARADLALDWCEALLAAGEVGTAADAIAELGRFANGPDGSERLRAWHTCFASELSVLTAPETLDETAKEVAAAATSLASQEDSAGEAKAHFVHALALARLGRVGACEAALDLALAAARRAGDRRRANTVLAIAPRAALWGPGPVTRASGRCLDVVRVLRITQGSPAVEAVALNCQGVLEALRGRADAAHRMIASARKMVEELGVTQRLFETDVFTGLVALTEGDAPAAERVLRRAYEGLRDLGLGIDAAQAAALLARTLLSQDRIDEAEALSHECEALAGDDLKAAIAWRGVRAEALARRGEHDTAIELATKAVEIAAATDALLDHADARLALAAALRAAGRAREADAEERQAMELWEKKGATILAERAAAARAITRPAAEGADSNAAGDLAGAGLATSGHDSGGHPEGGRSIASRRRVHANAASVASARFVAAVAGRDFDSIRAVLADDYQSIDHSLGATYGADEAARMSHDALRSRDAQYESDAIATLGPSLLLTRGRFAATGLTTARVDVAEFEIEKIRVVEADEAGRLRRMEAFVPDRLGQAIARLYERYAELLPDGPVRERAAATARSVATITTGDIDRLPDVGAPDMELVDHRTLGSWNASGPEALREQIRALREIADGVVIREDDVLGVAPEGLLLKRTHSGTERAGGSPYERPFLALFTFGSDGKVTRGELFDLDAEERALARFDDLTTVSADPRRRVRPNVATESLRRAERLAAERNFEAHRAGLRDDYREVDHQTGVTLDADQASDSLRRLFRSENPYYRHEILATLGSFLVLASRRVGASGAAGRRYDVGPYENTGLQIFEMDEHGRCWRSEVFGVERLGDAFVRFYELYAEGFPEGPERARAEAVARSVPMIHGPQDPDRMATAWGPDLVGVDHRTLGTWTARGATDISRHFRLQRELAPDFAARIEKVLALEPDANLVVVRYHGTGQDSGGSFENPICLLNVYGPDGLLTRYECFEAEQEAEALARFDEVVAAGPKPRPRRRVRPNAVTRNAEREEAAVAARDVDAFRATMSETFELTHHPTGSTYGRDENVETFRLLFRADEMRDRVTPLATLGSSLGLVRHSISLDGIDLASGASAGPAEVDQLGVFEADEEGIRVWGEVFADNQLGPAIVRLYERYAELQPEGAERERAAAVARAAAVVRAAREAARPNVRDRLETLAPDFEIIDHRTLGTWNTQGADGLREQMSGLREVADDVEFRVDDVLGLEPQAMLVRVTHSGIDRLGGGAYERPYLQLAVFDDAGRSARWEAWDLEAEADALARFDEVAGNAAPAPEEPFANEAWRAGARFARLCEARDWDSVFDMLSPDFRMIDRRRLSRVEADREEWLRGVRHMYERPASRSERRLLGTRGERLTLNRYVFRAEVEGGGPLESAKSLSMSELGEDGRIRAVVFFDADDEDTAWAELDRRYEAGEGGRLARQFREYRQAVAAKDPDALRRLAAPELVHHDHRPVAVLGVSEGADSWAESMRALFALAPDVTARFHHVRGRGRFHLWHLTHQGTWNEGEFEMAFVGITEEDEQGRPVRFDFYEPEQIDEALAYWNEVTGSRLSGPNDGTSSAASSALPVDDATLDAFRQKDSARYAGRSPMPPAPFFNSVALRFAEQGSAYRRRDWEGFASILHPDFRYFDRRRLLQVELDRDGFVGLTREIGEMENVNLTAVCLATRGDRLGLWHVHGEASGGDVGQSEIEHLNLLETDGSGEKIVRYVRFDPDDLGAAHEELDALYDAGEGKGHAAWGAYRSFANTIRSRDWEAMSHWLRADFCFEDHRLLGWGTMLRDPVTFVESQKALVELSPDVRYDVDQFLAAGRVLLSQQAQRGTREGGAFESPFLVVIACDEAERVSHMDVYDVDRLDDARRRFEELAAGAPSDDPVAHTGDADALPEPFRNAATRAWEGFREVWRAGDWERAAGLYAPEFRYHDRTPMAQLELDRDGHIDYTRSLVDLPGLRVIRGGSKIVATRGERLALARLQVEFEAGDVGPSELDSLYALETNDHGKAVTLVRFAPDDLAAAYAELDARYAAGEGAAHPAPRAYFDNLRITFDRRDWEASARLYTDDVVGQDYRLTGWGTLRGPTEFIRSLQSMVELAPDARFRRIHLRTSARGYLVEACWYGTRDGGEFESPFLSTGEVDPDGRVRRLEFFETRHFDRARARFAEIDGRESTVSPEAGTTPSGPFPNTATRVWEEIVRVWTGRDWERLAGLMGPEYRYEDRTPTAQLELDGKEHVEFTRMIGDMRHLGGGSNVLATRGDRLALTSAQLRVADADVGPSEIDSLYVVEVNEQGKMILGCRFDATDLDAAYDELGQRYAAGEGAAHPRVLAWLRDFGTGLTRRDWNAVARCHASDVVGQDHRLVSWGTLRGRDEYLKSYRSMIEIAPDARVRLDHLRTSSRGWIGASTWTGTRDGGAFESSLIAVAELGADGLAYRFDLYDTHHAEKALARFEEISRADSTGPPPTGADEAKPPPEPFANAASRFMENWTTAWQTRDWDWLLDLYASEFRYFDRTPMAQLELDGRQHVEYVRSLGEMQQARAARELLATRGERLALAKTLLTLSGGDVGPSEIESLYLCELNDRGEALAAVRFDPGDLDAAYDELQARWEADDDAGQVPAFMREFGDALERRDWEGVCRCYAPEIVGHDGRLTGWGTLHGREALVDVLRKMVDLAPDVRSRTDHIRTSARGMLGKGQWAGTRDGGAFEIPYVAVYELGDDGRAVRLDLFDPQHLDRALARFAETGASSPPASESGSADLADREGVEGLPVPVSGDSSDDGLATLAKPNLACAWFDRAVAAEDRDAFRALCAPDAVYEDRQRLARIAGGADLIVSSLRERRKAGLRPERRTLLGTAGERIAIHRVLWAGGPPEGRVEIEQLTVYEVDEAGKLVAGVTFDADDTRAAQREAWKRWIAQDPAVEPLVAAFAEARDAFSAHDRERILALFADDVVIDDHRLTGIGRVEGAEAYAASVAALWELSPDTRADGGWFWLAVDRNIALVDARRTGSVGDDGGPFESPYLWLMTVADGRITRAELFEIDQVDRALVRFDELRG